MVGNKVLRFVKNPGASMVRGSVTSFVGGGWSGDRGWRGKRGNVAESWATIVSQIVISNAAAEAT